jgi:hypothetical protein
MTNFFVAQKCKILEVLAFHFDVPSYEENVITVTEIYFNVNI